MPATEKQIAFIKSLVEQKLTAEKGAEQIRQIEEYGLTKYAASIIITDLLAMPNVAKIAQPKVAAPKFDIPAGRYAVLGEDGAMKFYRIDRPCEGKWAGYTFLKVQAGDDFHAIRGGAAQAILGKINADVRGALIAYGQLLGVCGVCGRTLTDKVSRAVGVGPICRARLGIEVPADIALPEQGFEQSEFFETDFSEYMDETPAHMA